MSEELSQPKYIKLGLALYALIFTLIALDIAEDYGDGMDWGHVSIELLVLLMAVMGLTLLGRAYYQNAQMAIQHLQTDLASAQQEAKRWRDESRDLMQGLGVEIQKQFARWGLTQAESEIGLLILKGFSHQEIADIRSASERTVREQARALYRKAGLTGRASLSAFFLEDLLLPTAPTT
ncbi:MAG TPA: LuxR C-terminal-related transcriptional regulator [Methylophilus sp.]